MTTRIARFRSEEVRARFEELYDRAMEELWPVEYHELDVETTHGTTRIHRCGPTDSTPVVLLHGNSGTSVGWAPYVERLAGTRDVLAVDVIGGLGRSVQTRPIDDTRELAVWFRSLLEALGLERVHVVGFSEGGFVAFHAALDNTDRVASMTAIDSGGIIERVKIRFLLSMVSAGLKTAVGVPGALRRFGERLTPGVVFPELWWDLVQVGVKGFRHALPMPKKVSDEALARLTVPTLLYMAGDSEVYDASRAAERARRLMPDVQVAVVEGAQHGLPFTHADLVWPGVLDFLDLHDTR